MVVLVVGVVLISGCTSDKGYKQPSSTTQKVYKFGDRVVVGNLAYTFHNMYTTYAIGREKADGQFLVLDVTIENIGEESETYWFSNVKIVDDQDRRFDHDSAAEIYLDGSFTWEQLQPGLPKRGKIVFDVPTTLKGYIEVSENSLFSNKKKYVSWSSK